MRMMRGDDRERWQARNLRENAGYRLKPGDRLQDLWWRRGVVTAVDIPTGSTPDDHGRIDVMLDDGRPETYAGHGWEGKFRVQRG